MSTQFSGRPVVERQGPVVVVTVVGEWDGSRVDRLAMTIAAEIALEPDRLVLDVSGVSFIDSYGLRDLLAARQSATEHQVRLELHDPSAAVLRLLDATRLREVFPVS